MSQTSTILLVDDEQKVLDLLGYRLQLLGYRVITATCGEEALPLVEQDRPDLIILDVTMPGVDGLTVCTRLKESETFNDIPILMLTARAEIEDVNRAMAAGADDYLVKPYDASVLQMKIRRHLNPARITVSKGRRDS